MGGEDIIDEDITDDHASTPSTDPYINKNVDKEVARKGDTLTYTLTVVNPIDHDLYNVKVTDTLPASVEVVESSLNGGSYDSTTHIVTWILDKIDKNGGTYEIEFDVTIVSDSVQTFVNHCMLVQGTVDVADNGKDDDRPTTYDKPGSAATNVILDPTISKARDKAIAGKGETIEYTLSVSNPDTLHDMHNVVVTDTIPAGLELVEETITGGGVYDPDTRTITWTIDEIPAYSAPVELKFSASVIFTTEEDGREEAIWYNTAYITESTPDVNGDGNPDPSYKKEYGTANHSETVETDTCAGPHLGH